MGFARVPLVVHFGWDAAGAHVPLRAERASRMQIYACGMLTIVALLLALTVLPSPWGWVAVIVAALIDVLETLVFLWWSKRRKAAVGVETLVGRQAVVVRTVAPRGQVKLDGEVWDARATEEMELGAEVVVTGLHGLVLDVERRL